MNLDTEKKKIIEIDCPPGHPRPDHYLPEIIEETKLEPKDDFFRLFGAWKWDYSHIDDEYWKEIQGKMKERIERL